MTFPEWKGFSTSTCHPADKKREGKANRFWYMKNVPSRDSQFGKKESMLLGLHIASFSATMATSGSSWFKQLLRSVNWTRDGDFY